MSHRDALDLVFVEDARPAAGGCAAGCTSSALRSLARADRRRRTPDAAVDIRIGNEFNLTFPWVGLALTIALNLSVGGFVVMRLVAGSEAQSRAVRLRAEAGDDHGSPSPALRASKPADQPASCNACFTLRRRQRNVLTACGRIVRHAV